MKSRSSKPEVIDKKTTIEKHKDIISEILPMHALTGCDTVASFYGIGKLKALKVLRSGKCVLDYLGDSIASIKMIHFEFLRSIKLFIPH